MRAELSNLQRQRASQVDALTNLQRQSDALAQVVIVHAAPPHEVKSIQAQEEKATDFRARLVAKYAPFYQRQNLGPKQIDAFESTLTEDWERRHDIQAVADQKALSGEDPGIAALSRESDSKLLASKEQLLGPDGAHALQEYERTLPARELVTEVARQLYYVGSTLTADQADRLTQAIANNSDSYLQGGSVNSDSINWDKALQVAQPFLDHQQFVALQHLQQSIEMPGILVNFMGRRMRELQLIDEAESETTSR